MLQYCKSIPFDFHIENRRLRDMNVSLELKVNDGLELPLTQSEFLVKSWGEKIVLSKVHLVDKKFAGKVKIGTLTCTTDAGDRAECDLHTASKAEGKVTRPTASAAIRLVIRAGSHSVERYAWSAETL